MTNKLLVSVFIASLSVMLITGCDKFMKSKDAAYGGYRDVIVHDVGFRIPKNFYDPMDVPANNTKRNAFLLEAELPLINKLVKSHDDYLPRDKSQPFVPTGISVNSPLTQNNTPTLNLAQRIEKFSTMYKATQKIENLFGLSHLVHSSSTKSDREILFEGKQVDPATYLFCNSEKKSDKYFPRCQMQFYYKNLIVEVSFDKEDWLPQWKEIKNNTIKRLDEFNKTYQQGQKIN